jgi:hypothetical protein
MTSRRDTTMLLSELVEKRLDNQTSFWASEVNFDLGTPRNRRIDYIGFTPWTPNHMLEPASVELGVFSCYEVKSCMADFKSGHGLTFYGDENYLVTTPELAEKLRVDHLIPKDIDKLLVPTVKGDRLTCLYDISCGSKRLSHRRRTASEMLYAMVDAGGRKVWK